MKLLSLETSCEHASIALYLDGAVEDRQIDGHNNHSENILRIIHALLADAGMTPAALDGIAFGSGPGAFTGLRLSCGIAQGFALGAGLGVVPVCSLDALALQCAHSRILVATDARMGEVYCRSYALDDGRLSALSDTACAAPDTLPLPDGHWYGIGSAFEAYPALRTRLGHRLTGCDAHAVPRAREVALLAAEVVGRGGFLSAELATPFYVRDKVALTTAERLARGGKA